MLALGLMLMIGIVGCGDENDENPALVSIPDTGQTISYTTTFGEDSDYIINPMAFTDNLDGTVTDNNTGLMWQQQDDNTTRTWADAGTYCNSLSLGGYWDWRMPEKKELMRIVDYGTYNPAIDATYFPNTNTSKYWGITTAIADMAYAWYVRFNSGLVGYDPKYYEYGVRCVRNGKFPTQNFTDNGNGTVTDNNTDLMWQQQNDYTTRSWENAISYCEGLTLATQSDWRLPNIKELESITDDAKFNPAIKTTYFSNTVTTTYWSSTTNTNNSTEAWGVDFDYGYLNYNDKSTGFYTRCVRGE
jgi:hypothetical protein